MASLPTTQGTRENLLTYMALVPVVGGVVIATGGEPAFHLLGFIMCIGATAGRALKSVVQSMLMSDPTEKLDPMSLLLYMSGVCSVLLLPVVAIMEPRALWEAAAIYERNRNFVWWMAVNAGLAYLCNLLNFLVTKVTSALTLQVMSGWVTDAIVSHTLWWDLCFRAKPWRVDELLRVGNGRGRLGIAPNVMHRPDTQT
jgi:hypothetical protein